MRKGTTRVFFATTVTLNAPTAAQVNAGTELTDDISEITGFVFSNNPIQTPDLGTKFVSQIPGEDSTEDSSLVFYETAGDSTIKDALPKDENGYVIILPEGSAGASPAAADLVEVWPVTISSVSRRYSAGNEAAMFEVKFATTSPPTIDVDLI
jgi:hypothetical protein